MLNAFAHHHSIAQIHFPKHIYNALLNLSAGVDWARTRTVHGTISIHSFGFEFTIPSKMYVIYR